MAVLLHTIMPLQLECTIDIEREHMKKTYNLSLTVEYRNPDGEVNGEVVRENLGLIVSNAVQNGLLSGETDLEVESWWFFIKQVEYTTGKIGDSKVYRHVSYDVALSWIEKQKKIDPEGVARGDYYIDSPIDK
jgi:hypothetical protein